MAVTTWFYAPAFISAFSKKIDWTPEDKISIMLCTGTYTPDQDAHDYYDDVTNQLTTGFGYTAEDGSGTGKKLTTTTVTNTANVITLDSADPQWTATTTGITARIVVLCDTSSGVTTTDPLILWSNAGQNETASGGGTWTYTVAGTGWGTITAENFA
jgi:hypothetical protein